ncbi:MAG: hypothetical protein ACLROH_05880 [Streptococcus sp.]
MKPKLPPTAQQRLRLQKHQQEACLLQLQLLSLTNIRVVYEKTYRLYKGFRYELALEEKQRPYRIETAQLTLASQKIPFIPMESGNLLPVW